MRRILARVRLFWTIAASLLIAVGVAGLLGFFSDFQSRDWVTLVAAAAAFLMSLFSLTRSRVPQPHWKVTEVYSYNQFDLHCRVKQIGPGVAENVAWDVRAPHDEWVKGRLTGNARKSGGVVARNESLTMYLWAQPDDIPPPLGNYKIRLRWTALPDTTRQRSKTLVYRHRQTVEPRTRGYRSVVASE